MNTQGKQESNCRNNARKRTKDCLPVKATLSACAWHRHLTPYLHCVNKQRRIAVVPPFLDRAVCDGAVRTFSEVDVLEVEGRSGRNLESRVMRADVNNSYRKSPLEEACRRWCARLEVDTPLYHGFRRNNTPEHAKRLIPRCVTSTPSLACERCVLQWNARRKDLFWQLWELGATVADILLHPEARPSGVTLVKTIHVIRAVEYNDATMDQWP